MQISIIGLDIAKNIFQVHGLDENGEAVLRRRIRRGDMLRFFSKLDPCLVAMEACATAHYWSRELTALGHEVRLLPPAYVKPYVKRGKNDAIDAEAICEAASRPGMHVVPVKSAEQQAVLALHRTRSLLVRQRTALVNSLRAHLAEFGFIAPQGVKRIPQLIAVIDDPASDLPALAREVLRIIVGQLDKLERVLRDIDRRIVRWCRQNDAARRLATIPGVGPITASALAASVPDASQFRSGRHFAAWLGLVPRQNSSGGKTSLGRISKMGDRYLRKLLVVGMTSVMWAARRPNAGPAFAWARALLERRPARLVTVALANKTARIAWALLAHGGTYRAPAAAQTA